MASFNIGDWQRMLVVIAVAVAMGPGCNIFHRLHENNAMDLIRSIRGAEVEFKASHHQGRYGTLKELVESKLVKPELAAGVDDGYRFDVTSNGSTYSAIAVPLEYSRAGPAGTGAISFYVDETNVIRGGDKHGGAATRDDVELAR